MSTSMPRRDFLKAAPAAGALTYTVASQGCTPSEPEGRTNPGQEAQGPAASQPMPSPADVRIGSAAYTPVAEYPIRPKRHSEVTLADAFWGPKVRTNAEVTIPFEFEKASERGRGINRNVLEAAILSLAIHPDPALQAAVEAHVRELTQGRQAREGPPSNRGFEVAATYFNTTGRRDLLDRAIADADVLYRDFQQNNPPFSGGERDAVNCLQLYRVTHDKKHLDMAKHYLDIRGLENSVNRSRHNQAHMLPAQMSEAVGHAVNCVTLMVSLADVGVLTGLDEYYDAAVRMWEDVVNGKTYITGGVGTTGNEGFGDPYSLPNISAYSETCAVLMFITLNLRLFLATGDAKYIDVMERGMYNNALDGVSVSGNRYFYVNRLASAGDGRDLRWDRASLECCPPNMVRFMASMPGYIYAQGPDGTVYVNLYVSSEASFPVGDQALALSVESEMPWGGGSSITVSTEGSVRGTLKLRIPGWARNRPLPSPLYSYLEPSSRPATISVNGEAVSAVPDAMGYVSLDRLWENGDRVDVEFPMEIRRIAADERVRETRRRVAVERGPVVYCAEWPDIQGGEVLTALLDPSEELQAVFDGSFFGGAVLIQGNVRSVTDPGSPSRPIRLIPYYLWANRGAGEMAAWLSSEEYAVGDTGPAGGYIFYVNPNYAEDGWRYLEAAPFDQSAGAQWGCFRREIPGARGTAIGTGRQNTADILAACSEPGTAAYLCANLELNGVGGWFLPSRDELAEMYRALRANGDVYFGDAGIADNFTYWASTQSSADMAAHIDFPDFGRLHGDDKDLPRRVRAVRAI